MPASKWFRVATEGATTDGRKISRDWLTQIANNFNREKYGARMWIEHMRSMSPDGTFKAMGDVIEVKAEEVDGKLTLFAKLDPTEEMREYNRNRQKVYTSCEIDLDFAGSGEANLVGLGVTDSPASLGTDMLTFSSQASANPLANRKQRPENIFTAALETNFEFEETNPPGAANLFASTLDRLEGLARQFNQLISAQASKTKESAQPQPPQLNAIEELARSLSGFAADFRREAETIANKLNSTDSDITELKTRTNKIGTELGNLNTLLETTEAKDQRHHRNTGSSAVSTDC